MMSLNLRPRRALGVGLLSVAAITVALADNCHGQTKVARSDGSADAKHALSPAIRLARQSAKQLEGVSDYTALFRKMEIVKGKRFAHTMRMKFRSKPFSVYLYFQGTNEGQEVLYVDGQNNGNLLAHAGGVKRLAGTLPLKPTSERAMREGRYPITRIGIAKMVEAVIAQWETELRYDGIKLNFYPDAKLFDPGKQFAPMQCKVLESRHLRRRRGVAFQITRLYIDKKTNLPVRVEQYGFPVQRGGKPVLLEEYTYWNVRTNVGLKDVDFDRKNPAYKF